MKSLRYVEPYCTPAECDHEGDQPCSHCCPCEECGAIRAESDYRVEGEK